MDILDQSEVDALLSAVESTAGDAGPDASPTGAPVRPYDFRRPERVSKDQMRALQTLHEAFSRNLGALLSGFLRTIVEVRLTSCEQMTYGEFISSLPNPTSFNIVSADPLEGRLCLEISPLIVYPIIDRLLGGSSQSLFVPQRPVTQIESSLIGEVTAKAMEALKEAWQSVREIGFEVGEMESNPQLVQVVAPNEVVVVLGFEVKLGSRAGTMNLCIPFAVIEPLVGDLAAQRWAMNERTAGREQCSTRIRRHLAEAPLELTAILAETTISVGDLLAMTPGDMVLTERAAASPIELRVEGLGKLCAHIGQHRGKRALRVSGPLVRDDDEDAA